MEEIEYEEVPCPLCGSEESEAFVQGRDMLLGGEAQFTMCVCRDCGHHFLNPRPKPEYMHHFYPDEYEFYNADKSGLVWKFREWLDKRRARRLTKGLHGSSRVLEIGCADGRFLNLIRQQGPRVEGVEFSQYAADIARERYGIPVMTGRIEDINLSRDCYDLVVMRHVFEHIGNPVAICDALARVLKPKGKLVLSLPNDDSWDARLYGRYWSEYDFPRHLNSYRPAILMRLLTEKGFKVVSCKSSPMPNGWARSFANRMYERRKNDNAPGSGIGNAFVMMMFTPIALFASLFRKNGRMVCCAVRCEHREMGRI